MAKAVHSVLQVVVVVVVAQEVARIVTYSWSLTTAQVAQVVAVAVAVAVV
jgi:hypothetical protein